MYVLRKMLKKYIFFSNEIFKSLQLKKLAWASLRTALMFVITVLFLFLYLILKTTYALNFQSVLKQENHKLPLLSASIRITQGGMHIIVFFSMIQKITREMYTP